VDVPAFLVGIFGIIVLVRMILIGGASVSGDNFRRSEQPVLFWSIFVFGLIGVIFIFYFAFSK
jgi:lipid-A-disaccharide synthase-like uncharacterized protein